MPTLTATLSEFILYSKWTATKKADGTLSYSYPTLAKATKTFDLSGIMQGSTVTAAKLEVKTNGRGDSFATNNGVRFNVTNDKTGANARNVLEWFSGMRSFGSFPVAFSFRAYGGTGAEGNHSAFDRFSRLKLTLTYTLPYTACTPPSSLSLSVPNTYPGQKTVLSWSGDKPGTNVSIAGYEIYRAASRSGSYSKIATIAAGVKKYTITSPSSAVTYYYKVKTLGSVAGYHSALSSAVAILAMTSTPCAAPRSVTASPASPPPGIPFTLQWTAGAAGTNNPVTGYRVYHALQPGGPFEQLVETANTSLTLETPQEGAHYYKVVTCGTYIDSALSSALAGITVDRSQTSDCLVPAAVDAGDDLSLRLLDHLDKTHTLFLTVGSGSSAWQQTVELPANTEETALSLPLNALTALPNRPSAPMEVRVSTQGAGVIKKTVTLRCPSSAAPLVSGAVCQAVSSVVPADWGLFIAGHSAANVTLSQPAQGQYGATIRRYAITGCGCDAQSASLPLTGTSDPLPQGEQVITVTATDSRGLTGSQQITVSVLPYQPPLLRDVRAIRCDENGDEDDEGLFGLAQSQAEIAPCGGKNSCTVAIAYRRQGQSAWTAAGSQEAGQLVFGDGQITRPHNWDIRFTVSDALGFGASYYDLIPRSLWEMHVKRGGGAWAFGGVADTDGALHVYGNVLGDNITNLASRLAAAESDLVMLTKRQSATGTFNAAADEYISSLTTRTFNARRVGQMMVVYVMFVLTGTTTTSDFTTVGALPANFYPAIGYTQNVPVEGTSGTAAGTVALRITSSGELQMRRKSAEVGWVRTVLSVPLLPSLL